MIKTIECKKTCFHPHIKGVAQAPPPPQKSPYNATKIAVYGCANPGDTIDSEAVPRSGSRDKTAMSDAVEALTTTSSLYVHRSSRNLAARQLNSVFYEQRATVARNSVELAGLVQCRVVWWTNPICRPFIAMAFYTAHWTTMSCRQAAGIRTTWHYGDALVNEHMPSNRMQWQFSLYLNIILEEVSPSHSTLGSGKASRALSAGSAGQSPARKWFYCNLISADRLCCQQVTANSSPFRPEK